MIFGAESWLGSSIKDREVFPSAMHGYSAYRKDHVTLKGWSVFIAV